MLSAEVLSEETNRNTNFKRRNQPLLQSGICSRVITTLPKSPSAARHEGLSRRSRKTGKLSFASSTSSVATVMQSSRNFKKESYTALRSFGLQIESEKLVWLEWEPGEEYTKDLLFKNVSLQVMKIRYASPSTQFFSTLFPHLIVLSPGTSVTLPITFRPLELKVYEDKIHFNMQNGSFDIVLQGLFHQYQIHIPNSIHFGLSSVNLGSQLKFKIQNVSDLVTHFSWDAPKPFQIVPVTGVLQPKSSLSLHATFCPTSAIVSSVTAVCRYGINMKAAMTLDGIGKFPYIVVRTESSLTPESSGQNTIVDFKTVSVHHTIQKNVVLVNVTNVAAAYTIKDVPKMVQMEKPFHCKKKSGLIAPLEKEHISIEYSPHAANSTDIAHYQLSTTGGVTTTGFECIGVCEGPKVIVSDTLIDFGILQPKEISLIKTFKIINQSSCEAIFQFELDDTFGVFCVDTTNGILPGRQSETIQVIFEPPFPINYYKKAVLQVHEQGPIFIEFIGTKHNIDVRSPALLPEHLDHYWTLVSRGLSFYSPHNLQSLMREGKVAIDESGIPFLVDEICEKFDEKPITDPMLEYFDDGHYTETTVNPPHVSLDRSYIWMGRADSGGWSTIVRLSNHTYGKVLANWMPDDSDMFKVIPLTAEIFPMRAANFKIVFKYEVPDQFIRRQLECYVSYKCLRDYRIVENFFVIPPWLLTVDIVGHTCDTATTVYPNVIIDKRKLVFPPNIPDNPSFRTVVIENKGDTPVLYQFIKGQYDCAVKPPINVSISKYQISIVRFTPENVGIFKDKLTMRSNDDEKHDQIIEVVGSGEEPELLLKNGGELYFKPTCIHSATTSEYEIQNISRCLVRFGWHIPKEYQKNLSVEPSEGVILPQQKLTYMCTFSPTYCADFEFIVLCYAWPDVSSSFSTEEFIGKNLKKFKLKIIAKSLRGEIRVEKSSIDFGSIVVGSTKTENIVLYNDFSCDLYFRLSLKQVIDNEYGEARKKREPLHLKLSAMRAVLPARSRLKITAEAFAHRRVIYTWFLYSKQLTSSGAVFPSSKQSLLCQIVAEGIYPTVTVVDARSTDKGKFIRRRVLWKWFDIDQLNACLDCDPEPAELLQTVAARRRSSIKPSVYTNSVVTFNFGAAPLAGQSCFVDITFKNTSSIACNWAFFFPSDLQMDLDPWAIDGLMDSGELHVTLIESNKLFTVSPKQGTLNPEEKCSVTVSYKHDMVGTHRIPILFKIDGGKEILLEFVGITAELGRRYLHFAEKSHYFAPICVGEPLPPKQIYELHNGGSVPVIYQLDTSPLLDLSAANFDQQIFTCLNPLGKILPQQSVALLWIFAPLESKAYEAKIPIRITDGETAEITFIGAGYDRRHMGESEPMRDKTLCNKLALKIDDRLMPDEQVLRLSSEYICFGNVPVYGRMRHVVFLTNTSEVTTVCYKWHTTSEIANKVLKISPMEGHLLPFQSTMCTVVFCGVGPPSFYDVTLMCEVVDLVKKAEYKAELEAWNEECERQAVEFCITSQTDLVCQNHNECLEASSKKLSRGVSKMEHLENALNLTPDHHLIESKRSDYLTPTEFKTFQTLPPIRMDSSYGQRGRESMIQHHIHSSRHDWMRPQPPKSTLVQLTITARTHNANIYRQLFPYDCEKHFVDRTMQSDVPQPLIYPHDCDSLEICCTNEQIMVKMILAEIIRGLLDDTTFHDSIRNLEHLPVMYFKQLPRDYYQHYDEDLPLLNVLFADDEIARLDSRHRTNQLMSELLLESDDMISDAASNAANTSKVARVFSEGYQTIDEGELKLYPIFSDEELKIHPNFGVLLENIMSEIVGNVMEEAVQGEVLLTVRPRIVALPPSQKPNLRMGVAKLDTCLSRPLSRTSTHRFLQPAAIPKTPPELSFN